MTAIRAGVAFTLLFASASVSPAVDTSNQKLVATSVEEAGIDFAIQGEYLGKARLGGKESEFGAQVIALANGKFDLVLYTGGLPGAGWKRGDQREKVSGATENGETRFAGKNWSARIEKDVLKLNGESSETLGELKKTARKSPTLGAKPPKEAVVLFDGTSAEKFKNGRLTKDGLLMVGCETVQKFGDHTLHIEFRTPFQPGARGQGRGNSGVYIQGRYECQVLDSFGLEGENNECGGIYSIAKPLVNACFPPLSWQTYDIDFTAARFENGKKVANGRVTIRHNGIVIHDNLELTHGTPGKANEGPGPEVLYLQDHGNPVHFRNIWLVER